MKKLLLLAVLLTGFSSCTKDDCNCEGQFYNLETKEYMHQPTDCDRTPPEGHVFVKCLTVEY